MSLLLLAITYFYDTDVIHEHFISAAKNKKYMSHQKSRCAELNAQISNMGGKLVLKKWNTQEFKKEEYNGCLPSLI